VSDAREQEFRPRKHDSLVEPIFAGLGVEGEEEPRSEREEPSERATGRAARPGAWARLLRFLGLRRARASRPERGR
jgi:hypothetical protein